MTRPERVEKGETGPYVQYSHARAMSILRKAGVTEIDPAKAYAVASSKTFSNKMTRPERVESFLPPCVIKPNGM